MTKLWMRKWDTGRGWMWVLQRECSLDEADQWMAIFKKDHPENEFKLSEKKPKLEATTERGKTRFV